MLKSGGRAAWLAWGPRDDTTMFAVFAEAAEAALGPLDSLEAIDFARPFALGAPGALRAALEAGGLAEVEERAVRFAPRVPADAPFWRPQFDMAFGRALDGLPAPERRALEEAVAAGFQRHREGDALRLAVHTRIGTGIKPGA